ncbi:hypothetical protein Plhal304r1_c012g0047891 [Plasmopara halstedii]
MTDETLLSTSKLPHFPAAIPVKPENTVEVFVADFNGVALPVMVPVGTTMTDVVDAAYKMSSFKKGDFLGFKYVNLRLDDPVTAADATRWTANEPLRLKFKHNGWVGSFLVGAAKFGFAM